MSNNKRLCCCINCLNKSNGEGKYLHITTWNKHKRNSNINQELEDNPDSDSGITSNSDTSSSMSGIEVDDIDGIIEKKLFH